MRAKMKQRGFSAVELLVAITFSGIVISLLAVTVQSVRERARRNTCSSNIRQVALAMHNFESGNRKFPSQNLFAGKIPGNVTVKNVPGKTTGGITTEASYSFITQLLPQFEEGDMFESIDFDKNPFLKVNGKYCGTPIPVLKCPSFTGKRETIGSDYTAFTNAAWKAPRKPMLTQYVAMGATTRNNLFRDKPTTLNEEPDGFIYSTEGPIRDGLISDGMAKTIMLTETREEKYATWMDGTTAALFGLNAKGDKITLNRKSYIAKADFGGTEDWTWGPSSTHPGMAHHAFGDGAVRSISDDIEAKVYRALITKASKVQYAVSDAGQVEPFFTSKREPDVPYVSVQERWANWIVDNTDMKLHAKDLKRLVAIMKEGEQLPKKSVDDRAKLLALQDEAIAILARIIKLDPEKEPGVFSSATEMLMKKAVKTYDPELYAKLVEAEKAREAKFKALEAELSAERVDREKGSKSKTAVRKTYAKTGVKKTYAKTRAPDKIPAKTSVPANVSAQGLDKAITTSIELLEGVKYAEALDQLLSPSQIARIKKGLEQKGKSWDDYVSEFGQNKAARVLKAMKAVQGKRARLSSDGTVATFKFSTGREMYFQKKGDRWYFINRPPETKGVKSK